MHRENRVVQYGEAAEYNSLTGRESRTILEQIVDADEAEKDAQQHIVSVGHATKGEEAHQCYYQWNPELFHSIDLLKHPQRHRLGYQAKEHKSENRTSK